MVQMMAQALHVLMRGFISCFPQERVEKILIIASAMMAQQIASLYAGDDISVYKLRKACRDAFEKTMKDAPVIPHESPAADTATIGAQGG